MKKNTQQTKLLWLMMLLTLTTLLPTFVQAQVATNYNFSSSAGTYVPIAGGTVLGLPAQDDDEHDGLVLPFSFSFSGATMTHFAVNSNGFMTLATSATTSIQNTYNVISDGFATNTNVIAPFSADLQGGVSSGELSYTTLGTTPNRTLVVQWKDYRPFAGSGTPYNFQVRLSETSNVVAVVYGTFLGVSIDAEVGLMGANNTDYNNHTTSTNWAATTAGTTNADVCSISATVFPATGQTFTWTPASCIGVGGLTASAITTTTATLNWSSNASAVGGYNVQYRLFGAPSFTALAGNPVIVGTSANITGLNPSSTYEFQVQTICAGVGNTSSFSPSNNFNTACVAVNVFPYFEGFEGITVANQFPNCMAKTARTFTEIAPASFNRAPRTGTKYGYFQWSSTTGGDYIYSAPLALIAGKTYDFSVWYSADGDPGWTNLDAWVGPNQNPTGLIAIAGASTTNITNTAYQPLAGSFVPATTGVYYVALRAVGNSDPWYLNFDDMSVVSPCVGAVFTTLTLPAGTTSAAYNETITATGGVAPYTFSVTNGTLPAGLTLDPTTGVISGTPTTVNITPPNFTVTISDATSCTTNKNYSIVITSVPCVAISITPTTVPAGTLGVLYPATAVQFVASGVTGATYAYNIVSGVLPSGMTLSSSTGRLTGTPNSRPASPTITVRARITTGLSAGCFGIVTLDLVVNCPIMTFAPATISDAVVNLQYSQQFTATYGTTTPPTTTGFTFTTTSTLPLGFTLSTAGVLSGTSATLSTPTSITIKATRSNGCNVSQIYMFGVVPTIEAPEALDPIQISSSSFRARWKPVARAAKYRLYIATSPNFDGGTFAVGYIGLAVVGDTSILVQNLKPETKYYYQITAISSADEVSPYSNIKSGTTLSAITSIDNALSSQVKVSPNPSNDKFSVDFGTLNLGKTTARVYDAQGKQVLSSEINATQATISLGNMANGIYLLEISSNKGRILKRLIKE